MQISIRELDLFYMSYDEPRAEHHWADLQSKVPWAQRVHGVKGFDAVHRRCGELAQTDYLITVDGDTLLDTAFLDLVVDLPHQGAYNLCWASRNLTNGLAYGNGGLKLWEREFIRTMAFHELGYGVDFCWHREYRSLPEVYSTVDISGSPAQSYRAGFREGVKLASVQGQRLRENHWEAISPANVAHLATWCSIGLDAPNGVWALLGARHGLIALATDQYERDELNDLERLSARLNGIDDPHQALQATVEPLKAHTPFNFPLFTAEQSEHIKFFYQRPANGCGGT